MKDEEWTMKDGKKIMVEDMDERHAKNCLRLMIRRVNEHNLKNGLLRFQKEMKSIERDIYLDMQGDR